MEYCIFWYVHAVHRASSHLRSGWLPYTFTRNSPNYWNYFGLLLLLLFVFWFCGFLWFWVFFPNQTPVFWELIGKYSRSFFSGHIFPPSFSCCLKCKWEETAACHMELSEEQDIPAYLCSRLLIIRHPTGWKPFLLFQSIVEDASSLLFWLFICFSPLQAHICSSFWVEKYGICMCLF